MPTSPDKHIAIYLGDVLANNRLDSSLSQELNRRSLGLPRTLFSRDISRSVSNIVSREWILPGDKFVVVVAPTAERTDLQEGLQTARRALRDVNNTNFVVIDATGDTTPVDENAVVVPPPTDASSEQVLFTRMLDALQLPESSRRGTS